jgi:hypothetical protein
MGETKLKKQARNGVENSEGSKEKRVNGDKEKEIVYATSFVYLA